jgi:hypothetical protein
MSKNDEYRANAVECERMAKVARNETDKQSWLGMARHWLAMIGSRRITLPACRERTDPKNLWEPTSFHCVVP